MLLVDRTWRSSILSWVSALTVIVLLLILKCPTEMLLVDQSWRSPILSQVSALTVIVLLLILKCPTEMNLLVGDPGSRFQVLLWHSCSNLIFLLSTPRWSDQQNHESVHPLLCCSLTGLHSTKPCKSWTSYCWFPLIIPINSFRQTYLYRKNVGMTPKNTPPHSINRLWGTF